MKTFAEFVEEKRILELDVFITEENLYEMARVQKRDSRLPQMIFVSTRDYGTGNHWARIKVSNIPGTFSKNDNFSVSISVDPRIIAGKSKYLTSEMNDIFDWIKLNHDTLIKYWNNQYETDSDFYIDLKRFKSILFGHKSGETDTKVNFSMTSISGFESQGPNKIKLDSSIKAVPRPHKS